MLHEAIKKGRYEWDGYFSRGQGKADVKLVKCLKHEKKVILVSENDLFLTLGSDTASARNENLRPLLHTNIPLISGKYTCVVEFNLSSF